MEFLDSRISKQNQLRIIVGLLCTMVLYKILMDVVSVGFLQASDVRKIVFNLANALVFIYLYKFIRYDLKLKLHVVFIGIVVFINTYFVILILYKSVAKLDPNDIVFGNLISVLTYVISCLKFIAVVGIAIQLLLNKYFKKKIKIIIQILGGSFILQIVGPMIMAFLFTTFVETFFMTSDDIHALYEFADSFFNLIPYIVMIYLYVCALDQPVVEEEL